MNTFLQGLKHGEEGREGERQVEPQALCLQDRKPGRSSRREKSNDLAADGRGRAVGGDGRRYSFHSMGLLGKGDRS